MSFALTEKAAAAVPLHVVAKSGFKAWLGKQDAAVRQWVGATKFTCDDGKFLALPGKNGKLAGVVVGTNKPDMWSIAHLAHALPTNTYKLAGNISAALATQMAAGWALGAYRFTRYKKSAPKPATLVMPGNADRAAITRLVSATWFARDLITTPAVDMLPDQLEAACRKFAKENKAKVSVLEGEELLVRNYPTIYTVGKGSTIAPRLVDIRHGKAGAPKVTLVGKGVCFDSGGLDIKSAGAMKLMKKDMAGVAILLALGQMVIQSKLNINLRILCPLVENAVSGSAMRPLDVVKTRKGITVEIGDTDAEGRLILCDALAEADREKPDLIIDCSTLTGAARVALGTDMPAFFTTDDKLAAALAKHSAAQHDPLYRLPLYAPYRSMLKSDVADISNISDSGYAGAITAALFLKEFVENAKSWVHLDMMAWNLTSLPGRPKGAEAQGLRSLFALLEERYG